MSSIINKKCRICFCDLTNSDFIDIFSEQGKRSNVSSITSIHFWFKIELNDKYPDKICTTCWSKIENFHIYYNRVRLAQDALEEVLTSEKNPYTIREKIHQNQNHNNNNNNIYNENKTNENIAVANAVPFGNNNTFVDWQINCSTIENISTNTLIDNESLMLSSNREVEVISDQLEIETNKQLIWTKEFANHILYLREYGADKFSKNILQQDELIKQWFNMECPYCGKILDAFLNIKAHFMYAHNLDGFLTCCNKKLLCPKAAIRHIYNHLQPNIFGCDICNRTLTSKRNLETHISHHVNKMLHPCGICKISYVHGCIHSRERRKNPECPECNKTFTNRGSLKNHMKTHQHLILCHLCGESLPNKIRLQAHHTEVHVGRFKCSICDKVYDQADSLRRHRYTHTHKLPYKCRYCLKVFKYDSMRCLHQKKMHKLEILEYEKQIGP